DRAAGRIARGEHDVELLHDRRLIGDFTRGGITRGVGDRGKRQLSEGVGVGGVQREAVHGLYGQVGFDTADLGLARKVDGFQIVVGAGAKVKEAVDVNLAVLTVHDVTGQVKAGAAVPEIGLNAGFVRLDRFRVKRLVVNRAR